MSLAKDLSNLCKIQLTDGEAEALEGDLNSIINYVKQLETIDTTNAEPCYQVVPFQDNILAEDEETDHLSTKEYLKNAPSHVGNLIRTPPVIQF